MSFPPNSRCARSPRRTDRGSAVITVLILAAVTAVIASSFLMRSTQEARLATRSQYQSVALNLAEAAVEEGLYAVNTSGVTSANGWTLVSGSTTDYQKSVTTGFNFDQSTGALYIRVDNAAGASPTITAVGVLTIPRQPKIVKQLRIGSTSPARIWANGVVAKGLVTFSGSADIDSYDSSVGAYNSATNRSDRATVATNTTVQITGSATIYGYVATGGPAPNVGGSGRIYGVTSPGTPLVDTTRVRTDFNANLQDATEPTTASISVGNVNSNLSLPRLGDLPGANGRFLYRASAISLGGNTTLTINGPVDLISDANVSVTGTSQIVINNGLTTSLNLYTASSVTITGSGMVNNTANSAKATIWGTKAAGGTAQSVSVGGNGAYVGTVYAPNANVQLTGSSGTYGAIIGNTVTVSGSGDMHYDVQLANLSTSAGPTPGAGSGSGYLRVSSWTELTAAPGSGNAFARDNRVPFNAIF